MAKTHTAYSDEWGEVTHISIEGPQELERGIVYHFTPATEAPHLVIVAAEDGARVHEVIVNDEPAQLVETVDGIRFVAMLEAGKTAEVRIRTGPAPGSVRADVRLGFFAKLRDKGAEWLRKSISNFNERCLACKALIRAALTFATGGADLAGDAIDAAIGALEAALREYLSDTILEKALEAIRGATNPSKLVAAEVCRKLDMCK